MKSEFGEPVDEQIQLERELDDVRLSDGSTLKEEFQILKERISLELPPKITIVDVVVSETADFQKILLQLKAYLKIPDIQVVDSSSYASFEQAVLASKDLAVILKDEATSKEANHPGWIHSQDQGFKQGRELKDFMASTNKVVVLVRYWDAKDDMKRKNILTLNDFNDSTIRPV